MGVQGHTFMTDLFPTKLTPPPLTLSLSTSSTRMPLCPGVLLPLQGPPLSKKPKDLSNMIPSFLQALFPPRTQHRLLPFFSSLGEQIYRFWRVKAPHSSKTLLFSVLQIPSRTTFFFPPRRLVRRPNCYRVSLISFPANPRQNRPKRLFLPP